MLRIRCPHCGVRDEAEFVFGGPAHVARPDPLDPAVDDRTWTQYLFARDNPRGLHCERWCHTFGCGRWFNVARDTVTHEIRAVYPMGQTLPPER